MAAESALRETPVGARRGRRAVIHPGAGGDEPPGRAPYSAGERAFHSEAPIGVATRYFRPCERAVFLFAEK